MLVDDTGDAPLNGVWIMVLVLGWLFSNKFWNNGPLLWVPVWCVCCVAAVVPIRGDGVAVGWYPAEMWLFVGLGVLLCCLLHAFVLWL